MKNNIIVKSLLFQCLLSLTLANTIPGHTAGSDTQGEENSTGLNLEEKHKLEKFHESVRDILSDDYERSDAFLLDWLKSKNWNIAAAKKMLKASKLWKSQNRIEKLGESEVDEEMLKRFPYTITADPETGCPVISVTMQDKWEITDFILGHEFPRDGVIAYTKHARQMLEKLQREVRKAYHKNKSCVTAAAQADMIGYTPAKVADINGISAVLSQMHTYNDNYPHLLNAITFNNVPDSFATLLGIMRKTVTGHVFEIIKFYKADKTEIDPESFHP